MRKLLQKLPFPVEFAVVVAGAFGLVIVTTLLAMLHPHPGAAGHSEAGMWRLLAIEAITLVLLGLFLWGRGWKGARLGLKSHWTDALWGILLAVSAYAASIAAFYILRATAPGLLIQAGRGVAVAAPHLTITVIIATALVSAFFEELFVTGYIISAWTARGFPNLAVNLSVAIRLCYHLYQGTYGVLAMIPIALIFAIWYGRTERLWPVVFAHVLLNLWAFHAYLHF